MTPYKSARRRNVAFVLVGSDFTLVTGGLPGERKRVREYEEREGGQG